MANDVIENCSIYSQCWVREITLLNESFAVIVIPVIVFMVLCAVVGALGNVILLVVYSRKKTKASSDYLIIVLGYVDVIGCLFLQPVMIYKLTHHFLHDWGWGCKVFEFLLHTNLAVSVCLFVAIAVDRYFAVCRPLRFLRSLRLVKILLAAAVPAGVTISFPSLEFNGVREESVEAVGGRGKFQTLRCHYQLHYVDSLALAAFQYFLMVLFASAVATISVLYIRVAVTARRRFKGRVYPGLAPERRQPAMADAQSSNVHVIAVAGENAEATARFSRGNSATETDDTPPVPQLAATIPFSQPRHNLEKIPEVDQSHAEGQASMSQDHGEGQASMCQDHGEEPRAGEGGGLRKGVLSVSALGQVLALKSRRQEQSGPSSAYRTAKMLFAVIAAFFVSWSPYWVLVVLTSIHPDFWTPRTEGEMMVERLLMHLMYVNNAVNPVIYAVFNRHFRQDSLALLKRCLCCRH